MLRHGVASVWGRWQSFRFLRFVRKCGKGTASTYRMRLNSACFLRYLHEGEELIPQIKILTLQLKDQPSLVGLLNPSRT
jgi:hypothetical protein